MAGQMQDNTNGSCRVDSTGSIYLVFRVFNLRGGEIGLRIYADPEVLRQKRELMFSADKYAVTPGIIA
jgi:hypothetical protein